MIDTIRIYAEISKELYDTIQSCSIVKSAVDFGKNSILYSITNDHLLGSYDSRLSVRVLCGSKYRFNSKNGGYCIEIEGSYHKISLGYNSHNGYCDLQFICEKFIEKVSIEYDVILPSIEFWFLGRCDVAICYDLYNQDNVKSYINSLSRCRYPRRKPHFYKDESFYISASTVTLKIYNKYLEFKAHDMKKFLNTNFKIDSYLNEIKGFLRFECEIHKRKLLDFYNIKDNRLNVINVKYEDLKEIWRCEFMKLLNFIESDLKIVNNDTDVVNRLQTLYKPRLCNVLIPFYRSIYACGIDIVRDTMNKSTFNRNLKYLRDAGVDISQSLNINEQTFYKFNPFNSKEVA